MVVRPADASVEMEDLLALTAEMVDIASESFEEAAIVAWIEDRLSRSGHLRVTRVGDNLVARTELGRSHRVILAGHTDTVPANGNNGSRREANTLWGLGSADMKGGLAVMLTSALIHVDPAVDLTYVFYAREEVATVHSGLGELFTEVPELLEGDVALLGEPTGAAIEAGCQGSIRAEVVMVGSRAHTARAWTGVNAVHRAGPVLEMLASYEPRRPELSGCHFHEAMLAVAIDGGVSGNVVPDEVRLTIAHRFAPDRDLEQAEAHLRSCLDPFLVADDRIEIIDRSPAAPPSSDHPLVAGIIDRHSLEVRAKLGWTDVARFAAHGVPAANFGPGDPTLAHTPEERLDGSSLWRVWQVIDDLVAVG